MADAEDEDAEPATRPHVWGIWKKQSIAHINGDAAAVLRQHGGLIGLFLRKTRLPKNTAFTHEDLRSVFEVVLLQAYASFDASHGAAFGTWACIWLEQAAIDVVRRASNRTRREQIALKAQTARDLEHLQAYTQRRFVSMQTGYKPTMCGPYAHTGSSGFEEVLSVEAPEMEDGIDARRMKEWLYAKLSNGVLTERERTVMNAILQGLSSVEIGEMLGMTRQGAEMHHRNAVRKLREAAEDEWYEEDV